MPISYLKTSLGNKFSRTGQLRNDLPPGYVNVTGWLSFRKKINRLSSTDRQVNLRQLDRILNECLSSLLAWRLCFAYFRTHSIIFNLTLTHPVYRFIWSDEDMFRQISFWRSLWDLAHKMFDYGPYQHTHLGLLFAKASSTFSMIFIFQFYPIIDTHRTLIDRSVSGGPGKMGHFWFFMLCLYSLNSATQFSIKSCATKFSTKTTSEFFFDHARFESCRH